MSFSWFDKDGMLANKQWRTEWLPFGMGMGPRGCIGFPFAMALLKMSIGRICHRFQLIPVQKEVENSAQLQIKLNFKRILQFCMA